MLITKPPSFSVENDRRQSFHRRRELALPTCHTSAKRQCLGHQQAEAGVSTPLSLGGRRVRQDSSGIMVEFW